MEQKNLARSRAARRGAATKKRRALAEMTSQGPVIFRKKDGKTIPISLREVANRKCAQKIQEGNSKFNGIMPKKQQKEIAQKIEDQMAVMRELEFRHAELVDERKVFENKKEEVPAKLVSAIKELELMIEQQKKVIKQIRA